MSAVLQWYSNYRAVFICKEIQNPVYGRMFSLPEGKGEIWEQMYGWVFLVSNWLHRTTIYEMVFIKTR